MITAEDLEFETGTITEVEPSVDENGNQAGWGISYNGYSLFAPAYDGTPKVGDPIRVYGRGIGYSFRGIVIASKTVFYRTAEEHERHERQMIDNMQANERAEYAAKKTEFDARIAVLPEMFQVRINGFRERNPDFGWRFEEYELMCCEQGVLFADTLKTTEALKAWHEATPDEQRAAVPGLSDGHSGNSFGFACRLAWFSLDRPDLIAQEHGALCPLVGCVEYGCLQVAEMAVAS